MLCKDPDRQAFSLHFVCECLKSDQVILKKLGTQSSEVWMTPPNWLVNAFDKNAFSMSDSTLVSILCQWTFWPFASSVPPTQKFPTKSKVQGHEMNFTQLEDGKKVSQEEPTFQKSYCANRKRTCRTQNTNNNSLFFQKWDHFGVIIKHCENSKFL